MCAKRIGILTGGGDCPGLNGVIRGVVRSAVRRGWEVIGIEDGFDGFLHQEKCRLLNLEDVRGILPRGGTILGTTNRGNPFSFPIMREGKVELVDVSDEVVSRIEILGISALVVVGGDGTLKIALELMKRGVPIVGVPKTIDNDLLETDVTFGYNTALETATDALDKLHSTAESHHRVMVLEVMGRYAGWIALESGIAGGADVILIPEIPYDIERVAQAIVERGRRGGRFSVIVAAEGAYPKGGSRVVKEAAGGKQVVERLGGVGEKISRELGGVLEMDVRVTVLGHLQRGGSPSTFDRCLSSRFGVQAVELIEAESFGQMVCLKGRQICSAPIEDAVRQLKLIDPEGALVRHAEELGIMLGR
ncbi:ATP-dependent 6-phosphofructokinase [Geomonas silvestris]|uniref:ATP-dependent 6-phosphofructokinase n=1 Tax=Geomonas silvestris TaxID=2740184 RepID=A0A6V8MMP7_9BACT|nr:6-phosphofructokinase [Geomonas silvestris]GFO61214.1 ATP-dependent 6-phosphofructokinase [Geomonas silvestris]